MMKKAWKFLVCWISLQVMAAETVTVQYTLTPYPKSLLNPVMQDRGEDPDSGALKNVLLPSWVEREADHQGNPLTPVFRQETLNTTIMAGLGKTVLIRQSLSADGRRRFVWLMQASLED